MDLKAPTAYKCTWTLEHIESDTGFTAEAEEQKLLKISELPSGVGHYSVVVSGQITEGPNTFGPINILSTGITAIAAVAPTSYDEFYFTGEIVSISADDHVISYVDGIEVANTT